jgi:hypothetical protein
MIVLFFQEIYRCRLDGAGILKPDAGFAQQKHNAPEKPHEFKITTEPASIRLPEPVIRIWTIPGSSVHRAG